MHTQRLIACLAATLALFTLSSVSMAATDARPVNLAMVKDAKNTLLRQDLTALDTLLQQLAADAETKHTELEQHYQTKTDETKSQQRALQAALIKDIIAYKQAQRQQLLAIKLSEPRVKAVRDALAESLNSDIKAIQIVLNNPQPTPAAKKAFADEMHHMQQIQAQAREQLQSLHKAAGMADDGLTKGVP